MQLPDLLQDSIERAVQKVSPSLLKKARESLSAAYREHRSSSAPFSDEAQILSYLATRMPATFSAVYQSLREINLDPKSILDLGAGPGTASWAVCELFPHVENVTLIESSSEAIRLGKELAESHPQLSKAVWIRHSLPCDLPAADLAILSYVISEISGADRIITSWWQSAIPYLLVVEPGTPRGFSNIRTIREQLIALGASILAPCPHIFACPIKGKDWCHFSARIERTRLHRFLKGGDLGYEDEKYSYLLVSKISLSMPPYSRILRHPQKLSGHTRLTLCTPEGKWEERVVTRSEKAKYRQSRDAEWGDTWVL
jgi:ribosomal protein RSM22 (predicted rRNA methylase)